MYNSRLSSCLLLVFVITLAACQQPQNGTHLSELAQLSTPKVTWPDWYQPAEFDTITVATWNTFHMVDDYDNPYINARSENNPRTNLEERRKTLAEGLRKLNADIVVFQEFESSAYLEAFAEQYLEDMGYELFLGNESNSWYQNVVMMSRLPLGTMKSYAGVTLSFDYPGEDGELETETSSLISNRMWSIDVLVNEEYTFQLTGLHLKAGKGPRNEAWRTAAINYLRAEMAQELIMDRDINLLVTGDLNTTPDFDDFQLLLGKGTALEFTDPLAGTDTYTHPVDSLFWRLDHMLPSRNMVPELVDGSVQAARPLPLEQMELVSDHLPVVARFVASDKISN